MSKWDSFELTPCYDYYRTVLAKYNASRLELNVRDSMNIAALFVLLIKLDVMPRNRQ